MPINEILKTRQVTIQMWNVLTVMPRFVSVSAGLPPPGASAARLHPVDIPAQSARRPVILGLLLDRPRVGAGTHLSRHSHHADHHHSEFGPPAWNAGRVVHQSNRRLDGHLSRLRLRFLYRVFGRQRVSTPREDPPSRHHNIYRN